MKKKMFVILLIVISFLLLLEITAFASDGLEKLDAGGQRVLTIVRRIGYWIILIKCITELVRAGMNGDTNSISRIVMKYILIYGALFFVPWALRLVEGIF